MFALTNELTKYRWHLFDGPNKEFEFDYVDWDKATLDHTGKLTRREKRIELGLPRYEITFLRIPAKRKREVAVCFEFDDAGIHRKTNVSSNTVPYKEIKQWEGEAITWLRENGYIKEV